MKEENGPLKRKKLGLWIPDVEVFNKFLSKVAEKHGQTYGRTGDELINAILLWLDREEAGGAETFLSRDTHTHAEKKARSKRKIKDRKAYPLTSRERRLKEIGDILFNNQITATVREEEDNFLMSKKGIERLIISQNISESRVIADYIKVMEIKGWIGKKMGRYEIFSSKIGVDLDLEYPEGYIEKIMERRKSEDHNGKEEQKA